MGAKQTERSSIINVVARYENGLIDNAKMFVKDVA
jgi:hypothetical protein